MTGGYQSHYVITAVALELLVLTLKFMGGNFRTMYAAHEAKDVIFFIGMTGSEVDEVEKETKTLELLVGKDTEDGEDERVGQPYRHKKEVASRGLHAAATYAVFSCHRSIGQLNRAILIA
jgi:hypothetical protein